MRRWVQAAVAAAVIALLVGRWMAASSAGRLWAEALGVAATHAQINRVQTMLGLTVFLASALWCVGNLLLVYRSIRSVHVPRKLGDLEILEAVPRRFLLYGVVGTGLVLALVLGHGATDWWHVRALTEYRAPLGVTDPVLGQDLSYYLFRLPWHRTVHSFAVLLVGVMLVVCTVLYGAIGAIHWRRRRLRITALARWHLAGLLCGFALMLFWGYRLEPAEYVGGIHGVPLDTVLTAVRIPIARMLSAAALLAAAGSALWFWSSRVMVVTVPWLLLVVLSFAGHYVVPSFAGTVRSAEELRLAEIEAEQSLLMHIAFGTDYGEVALDPAPSPDPRVTPAGTGVLEGAPHWDAFAVSVFLNRVAASEPHVAFSEATLGVYRSPSGEPTPAFVAPRQIDLSAASGTERELTWEQVHVSPLESGVGAVALQAHRTTGTGSPLFVPDLRSPQVGVEQAAELPLTDPRMVISPGAATFAVFESGEHAPLGVAAGGFWRRLALAWSLQSPQIVTADAVSDGSCIVWHRNAVERLNHFAPFARFGVARAAVVGGRLYWLSNGYVSASAFPLVPSVGWRGERVRYLRSSLLGIVDAGSGATAVYLLRNPDPLSLAWSQLAPEVVQTASQIPPGLLEHLPYPAEALTVQLDLLRRVAFPTGTVEPAGPAVTGAPSAGQVPYWWVGATGRDTVVRLRLLAPLEKRESGFLAGLVEGTVRQLTPVLELFRADGPEELLGPGQVVRRFRQLRGDVEGLDGRLRMIPLAGGVASLQTTYLSAEEGNGAPRVVDVSIDFGGAMGSGPTLPSALERLRTAVSPTGSESREWIRARQWFERMDTARRLGDWTAFGRAYEELRRLLVGIPDTLP